MTKRKSPARPASHGKRIALVLQGGGALGSYQAGAYEVLASSDYLPDWVAGISIGAMNAAIIAGNAPGRRVGRLRTFWEEITASIAWWPSGLRGPFANWQRKAIVQRTDSPSANAQSVALRIGPLRLQPPVANDIGVEHHFPGWPQTLRGRDALMGLYAGYGNNIVLHGADKLVVHRSQDPRVVIIEYDAHRGHRSLDGTTPTHRAGAS